MSQRVALAAGLEERLAEIGKVDLVGRTPDDGGFVRRLIRPAFIRTLQNVKRGQVESFEAQDKRSRAVSYPDWRLSA